MAITVKEAEKRIKRLLHHEEDVEDLDFLISLVEKNALNPSEDGVIEISLAKEAVLNDVKSYCPGDVAVRQARALLSIIK